MATVTITLTDVEDGVTVKLDSDVTVDWENLAEDATDAQRMAVSMLRLYEHAHDTAEKMQAEGACDGNGGCGSGGGGHCTRHKHTDPEDCCQNH